MQESVAIWDKFVPALHHNNSARFECVNHPLKRHQRFGPTEQNQVELTLAEIVLIVANGSSMQL